MRFVATLGTVVCASVLTWIHASPASACGGCFHDQTQQMVRNTQVTGHRMVLSVSPSATTLWDQIIYVGEPSEFAWVLPIKGTVEVGLSSDLLFQSLEQWTQITITSPSYTCPGGGGSFGSGSGTCTTGPSAASSAASGGGFGGQDTEDGVTVVAHAVVGPYETVQLSAADPTALSTWLDQHGYGVPADVAPVVASYVNEGFGFLALKLVPGQGVDAMRPVRVTTPGASPTLPLRMVAAGTGATTSVTLWVMGEGRYDPMNFPWFTIDESDLVWDFDSSSSNYKKLRQEQFDASNGTAWLVEAADGISGYAIKNALLDSVQADPGASGYGDESGNGAVDECQADLVALLSGIPSGTLSVTRLHAELARPALANDLTLGASLDMTPVVHDFNVQASVGTPPCPSFVKECGYGGAGTSSGEGGVADQLANSSNESESSCSVRQGGRASSLFTGTLALMASAAAFGLLRRRPRLRRG